MSKKISKPIIKKPPFFKKGTLVFDESNHRLTLSDGYYRCIKDSNGKCNDPREKQIKAENLHRAFGRFAQKFSIDLEQANKIVDQLMRENLCDILLGTDEKITQAEDMMDNSIILMEQDVKIGRKISKNDIKDYEHHSTERLKSEYPLVLFGYAIGLLRILSHPEREAELGRNFAMYVREVRITDSGKIKSICFEPWGWYLLNSVIERSVPNYLHTVKKKRVSIQNSKENLQHLNLTEASLLFGSEELPEAMGENLTVSIGLIKFMRDTLNFSLIDDPAEIQKQLPTLLSMLKNNPILELAMQVMAATNTKINKK